MSGTNRGVGRGLLDISLLQDLARGKARGHKRLCGCRAVRVRKSNRCRTTLPKYLCSWCSRMLQR